MSPRRWLFPALLVGLAALPARRAAAEAPAPLRVAVTAFETSSDDARYAVLGKGIQAMLATDLAVASRLRLVEREKLEAIEEELALTRSSAFDKATVVEVGKLLGATHLLTGAITVVGDAMRIDARLIDAASGEVVLGDRIEGDRELFFELEKALARKLVAALDTRMTPKERARLAKIHTADLEAFRRFSEGIEAFDRSAFSEATKALREALEQDAEFELARLTLDDYERIIAALKARGELMKQSERQAAADEASALAAEQKQIFDRLVALSESKDRKERLPALYALFRWHNRRDKQHFELHKSEDAFALARTCDRLMQTYVAEAVSAFPQVPIFGTRDLIGAPPSDAKEIAEDQERWLKRFFGTDHRNDVQVKYALLKDIRSGISQGDVARHLHLDVRGEARFAERVYRRALTIDPDSVGAQLGKGRNWREDMAELLGRRYRAAGLFDESTRWFAESGRLSDRPHEASAAARAVEDNRELARFVAAHPSPRVHEWLMLRRYDLSRERWFAEVVAALEEEPLGPRGRAALSGARDVRSADAPYVIIGGRPLFFAYGTFFHTGPRRSDRLVADDLDYYRKASRAASVEWWKAFYASRHQRSVGVRFRLGYAPDDEWWGPSLSWSKPDLDAAGYVDARPEVVVLFGVVDVDVPPVRDETRHERLQRGLRGYGLRIAADGIELVAVHEPEVQTGYSVARDRLTLTEIDRDGGQIADGAKVRLKVRGKRVSAEVGDLDVGATLDEVPSGFVGYAFVGPGHVRIVGPEIDIDR